MHAACGDDFSVYHVPTLRWDGSHSVEVNEKTWVTVRTRVTPSFMVRFCFRAIMLYLILKWVLVAH